MKPDTERKRYHKEKLHRRKRRLHVHLSKELRSKLKSKRRAALVHKGDTVKILRGPSKGKTAKVTRVSTVKRKVYVEGVVARNSRDREMAIPLEPSNLLLMALESTKERKEMFSADAFKEEKKAEAKKPEGDKKPEARKEEKKPAAEKPPAPKAMKPEEARKPERAEKPEAAKPSAPR